MDGRGNDIVLHSELLMEPMMIAPKGESVWVWWVVSQDLETEAMEIPAGYRIPDPHVPVCSRHRLGNSS